MVPGISSVLIILGIVVCHVSVGDEASVRSRCLGLIRACIKKFQQFEDNRLCRDLREAMDCLSTYDAIICGSPAVTHVPEMDANNSNEEMTREHEMDNPDGSYDAHRKQTRNDSRVSPPVRHRRARQDIGPQSYRKRQSEDSSEDYIPSIMEMIEGARDVYARNCSIANSGSKNDRGTLATGTILMGFFVIVFAVTSSSVQLLTK